MKIYTYIHTKEKALKNTCMKDANTGTVKNKPIDKIGADTHNVQRSHGTKVTWNSQNKLEISKYQKQSERRINQLKSNQISRNKSKPSQDKEK